MRIALAGLVLALGLLGCGQANKTQTAAGGAGYASTEEAASRGVAMMDAPVEAMVAGAPEAMPAMPPPPPPPADTNANGPQQTQQPGQPGGPSPVLYLAYAYQTTLEIPASGLKGVLDGHIRACQDAGPRLCQLVGSSLSGDPESSLNGYLSIRGEPRWLRSFIAGFAAQADAADGRILSQTTSTEDLTRQMVDTEARLRAQTSLRNDLQRLLDNRPGRLSDLLEVERELARVQGEIDALQSTLAVMRTRVGMSELTVTYQSAVLAVRGDTFRPLGDAFGNFIGIVVQGFAAIIVIIAGLLPFLIVIIPLVWALLAWRRRLGGRFFNRAPKPKPPEATGA